MGLIFDTETGRRRVCHALIFTACCSRHCFVWLGFSQTTAAVIEGFEAAWRFFDGVFRTVIPDNLSAVVDKANPIEPRLNQAFVEYAQTRGFFVDAARVRHPQDAPRGTDRCLCAPVVLRRGDLHRPGRRPTAGRAMVLLDGWAADPRDHGLPAG